MACGCGLLLTGVALFAQEESTGAAELKKNAEISDVQTELREPDGVAIRLKDDGSFQIFARGTGTYDFDDLDDVNDARKEAVQNAKANLSKFMKEKLSSEEISENVSKKIKKLSSDGETETSKVSKETVKVTVSKITSSSEGILKGVITLKEEKIPKKGKNSGEIQVTVGISSKTLEATTKLVKEIDKVPDQGTTKSQAQSGNSSGSTKKPVDGSNNKREVREAKTDF
jgi:hypothetical protein